MSFQNLERACGGSITIESLQQFQIAMREYEAFMAGMGELLGPRYTLKAKAYPHGGYDVWDNRAGLPVFWSREREDAEAQLIAYNGGR